jgi:inward rectifier potassium channel
MAESTFDPGFTRTYDGPLSRTINKDGSFNVRRIGSRLDDMHLYQFLVSVSWPTFLAIILAGYLVVNSMFALFYLAAGIENITGANAGSLPSAFLSALFFSTHTFTTVGYGTMSPANLITNIIASTEALVGLLALAIATGLLYGRFSRPTARFVFSNTMVVAPHKGGTALMFRVANRRLSTLMELEASLLLMTVVFDEGRPVRKYDLLPLEVPTVYFLPLTWTLVHPIAPRSPLHGKTPEQLAGLQAEVLVLIKGFDDRFQQTVYARYSYRHDEIVWGKRFTPAFHISPEGDMVLDLRRIHETQ